MFRYTAVLLLLSACPMAPDHIQPQDGGAATVGDAGADGGAADAGNPEAGIADAGIPDAAPHDSGAAPRAWGLEASRALYGLADDADEEADGFQLDLTVTGPSDTPFALIGDGQPMGDGNTGAEGRFTMRVDIDHGDHTIELFAGGDSVDSLRVAVDIMPPQGAITIADGRRPLLDWSDLNDEDGVGQDRLSELTITIAGNEPVGLDLEDGSLDLSHHPIGAYDVVLTATDEAGNPATFNGSFDSRLRAAHKDVDSWLIHLRPCVGELDGDRRADLVHSNGRDQFFVNGQSLAGRQTLPGGDRIARFRFADASACLIVHSGGVRRALMTGQLFSLPTLGTFSFDGGDAERQRVLSAPTDNPNLRPMPNLAVAPAMMGEVRPVDGVVVQRAPEFLRLYRTSRLFDTSSQMTEFQNEIDIALPATLPARHLVNGDFNGDGSSDFLVAIPAAAGGAGALWIKSAALNDRMSHVFNDNNATFTAPGNAGAVRFPTPIAFDAQAGHELAATNNQGDAISIISGLGGNAPQAQSLSLPDGFGSVLDMTACDLTGDGIDELIVGTDAGLWIRATSGQWAQHPYPHRANTVVCGGDFTGDGLNDIAITDRSGWISILH